LSTSWEAPLDTIFITLHPDVMRSALGEETYGPHVELVSNIVAHGDPVLKYLTFAMQEYLATDRLTGKIFEGSLLGAMAAHLVKVYMSGKRGAGRGMPLPRWKRARVEQFIRENLAFDLSLDEIATVVHMRPHQLSRAFRASTGQSLWQFVLETRAREAAHLMTRHPSMPLSNVAVTCGFESYPQFIVAFRKFFGQLPSEYRHARMK
ncbi:MAG: helix-turn-helix domain-containing protein, partial [Rhodoferax sp.]